MNEDYAFFLLKCAYLMLPAYFANMAPVITKKINLFAYPVDFSRKLNQKPIFGKNKTYRGFIFGIIFAAAVAYTQHRLYEFDSFRQISFFNYGPWLLFGIFMGFGALFGDLIKSFFKRRIGMPPGKKFIPFDQTDFIIGASVFMLPFFQLSLKIFIASLILSFALHITVNHIAFYLRITKEKW